MSASLPAASGLIAWRVVVIGSVIVLAAGIGVAAGTFMLTDRTAAVGSGASYVPASAPFYAEVRMEPSEAQDAALRELLGRFPPIEGIDLAEPLHAQLTRKLDEVLADEDAEVSWSADVEPWFDGHAGMALLELPAEAFAPEMSHGEVVEPSMVVLLGVTDRAAAEASIERLIATADTPVTFAEQVHDGVTIRVAEDDGAYALTTDQLLIAPRAEDIIAALDAHADGANALAEAEESTRFTDALPDDWLAFGVYDFTDMMAQALDQAGTESPEMADALRALLENQPMRGAAAVTAQGDRISVEAVSAPPTGPFAPENADRGLADEVPADAVYFADGGNIGPALAAFIGPMKDAAASTPEGEEQVAMVEAALGADLEDVVGWVDDGAIAVGYDGTEAYGGLVLVPSDVGEAERRLSQLASFAELAALDPESGISVEEAQVGSVDVTTVRWNDAGDDGAESGAMLPMPTGLAVQFAVTDDRAVIGLGERFVGRVLELDTADSLASVERFDAAVEDLGGAENTGVAWLDLVALREALESALGPMVGMMDPDGVYESEVRPWLEPLDALVSVTRLDGDLLVQRTALLVE